MKNKVSIITPVYNSEKYLRDCIMSVLNQTYINWEHLLVDDRSSDKSLQIIKEFASKDSRIRYHRLIKNSGAGIARNKAIEMAQGRFIAFLDSDDKWKHNKLEVQIDFMLQRKHPFTFTSYDFIGENGEKLKKTNKPPRKVTYKSALLKNPIGCLTVIYDSDFFGKEYMPSIRKRQDYALWLKLLKETPGFGMDESLAYYRVGNESISSNKLKLLKYEWEIYRKEEGLSLIKSLLYLSTAILLKIKKDFL